ncbi:unnamed protein product [marine sediment metagenome]|uniref:Uncharacterized protein n=1 Tax=marine sediment metagenome TaxID=412755 RepID=X1EDN2_9ZZZZ
MKKAPDNYNTDQIYNDILYLGVRLKSLEDLVDAIFDFQCDFLREQEEVTKKAFGFALKRTLKLEVEHKKLKKMIDYAHLDKRLKELGEEIEGLHIHYTESTLPTLSEIKELKDKKRVGKQYKY